MKKTISLVIIGLLFLNIAIVSAQITTEEGSSNFFKDLLYKIKKIGLFTAEGQARSCDVNARLTITQTTSGVTYTLSQLTTGAGCSSGVSLIDVFDLQWRFINEYRSEIIGDGLYMKNPGIIEVYCCPYKACTSNTGCSSPPASNYGTTCNTIYGSCYSSLPTHTTKLYNCVNGQWVSSGTSSYGQQRFCSSSSHNNYLSQTGNEGCYASAPSGWCTVSTCKTEGQSCVYASDCCTGLDCQYFQCVVTGTCTTGATKCIEDVSYLCVSGTWQSQGRVDGKCGYSSIECTAGQEKCEGTYYFTCLNGAWLNQGYVIGKCGYTSTCNTPADIDCNGKVSRAELGSYINLWINGSVTRTALGTVITAWATS